MKKHLIVIFLLTLAASPAAAYTPAQYNWQLRAGYVNHAVDVVQKEVLQAKEFVRNGVEMVATRTAQAQQTFERVVTYGVPKVQEETRTFVDEAKREVGAARDQVVRESPGFFEHIKDQAADAVGTVRDRVEIKFKQKTTGIRNVVKEVEAKIFGILQRNGFGFRDGGSFFQ